MFVKMLQTIATPGQCYNFRQIYDVPDEMGQEWTRRNVAAVSKDPPPHIATILYRLSDGADKPCLFLPFVGEFGHEVMSHIRMVHFHKASEKVVCCRPGCEVLYPSATEFVTDWTDPITDEKRVGTMRDNPIEWPELITRYPNHHAWRAGGMSLEQELFEIEPQQRIPFKPKLRGLKVDVVLGLRNRAFAPEKNWQHWQQVADALTAAGYSFAIVGARDTAPDLKGQTVHSGDLDTDAAIELLQNCRLYIGTDSGNSHLAAAVGAQMIVFRAKGMRDFVPRMRRANPGNVTFLADGWNEPAAVAKHALDYLRGEMEALPDSPYFVAQHGEDKWMAQHWQQLGLPDNGTFVEVGAADGKTISNSYWLAKAKGWRGLLIEPDTRTNQHLRDNRPESRIERCAVGTEEGMASFGLMPEPTHSGLGRTSAPSKPIQVRTLDTLLTRNDIDAVDVLSIDTEGTEVDVWRSLDLTRWKPRLVIMEWNTVGLPSSREPIMQAMELDGYKLVAELGGNLLFVPKGNE